MITFGWIAGKNTVYYRWVWGRFFVTERNSSYRKIVANYTYCFLSNEEINLSVNILTCKCNYVSLVKCIVSINDG